MENHAKLRRTLII